ncbi:MAG: tetratricopeptide repeat protein [Hyphococcus sp.]
MAGCVTSQRQDSAVGEYLSGRLAARANDVSAAADAFAGAQSEAPGAGQVRRDAFFFQLASGDFEKAIVLAERLARDPASGDDGLARLVLAARDIKSGRYQSARTLLAQGGEATFYTATANIVDAWALAGLSGPAAAAELLVGPAASEFKGFNPLHMALLADKAGRQEDARAAHQLSVMTYGGTIGRSAYGAFLERIGDDAAAREYYELLGRDPGPDREVARLGLARLAAGAASNAYADVTPAQGAAIAFYTLGGAILQQASNQHEAAERAGFSVGEINYNLPLALTQLALYLDPELDDARRFAGSILNAYDDHAQAVAILSQIDPSSPYFEIARIEMAQALAAQERQDEAVALLRDLTRRRPEAREARLSLSNLLASLERRQEAVAVLDGLIAGLPGEPEGDDWRFFLARGAYLLELDNWPRAEQDLQRAVDIAPDEPMALNYLGYSWVERGLNLDEAFALIEKAVSLDPSSGANIDSLGWAHYQMGDYEEAVGHLEQAASLEPADPTVTEHLGDVYWRLGRKIEARYQWERALELEPTNKQADAIREKLENGLTDDPS